MMVIPFQIDETQYSIFVILQSDNLERIQQYDPAEVTLNQLGEPFSRLKLKDVLIGYATEEEIQRTMEKCTLGKVREALQILSRGWQFRPGQGDYDGPYLSVKPIKGETKQ